MQSPTNEVRIPLSSLVGCLVVVDTERVNIQDLTEYRPGRIVRTTDVDAIRIIPGFDDNFDRIAGLISEE